MNENINLVEILKNAPKGTKLYSPLCGECEVIEILPCDAYPIRTTHGKGNGTQFYNFTSQGKFCNNSEAECLLFPSKENRDWTTVKATWMRKHFEPFQKVLYKSNNNIQNEFIWQADFYSHYNSRDGLHYTVYKIL